MNGAGPQGEDNDLIIVGTSDEGGKILVLVEVAVEQRQLLFAMRWIVDGVDVEGQVLGRRGEGGDELIDEQVTQPFERPNVNGVLEA